MAGSNDRPLHPGSACLPCRRRKAKCDGVHPICARCKRLGSICEFDPPSRSALARSRSTHSATSASSVSNTVYGNSSSYGGNVTLRSPSSGSGSGSPGYLGHFAAAQRLLARLPDEDQLEQLTMGFPRPNLPIYLHREGWNDHLAVGRIAQTMYPEAYETTVPRTTVEVAMRDWDPNFDPSPEASDYLIRLFIPFRRHFFFYMDINNLLRRIHLPQTDPNAIHPCLLNAIYLVTCFLVKGELARNQNVLLARLRTMLDESLAHVDRLTHFFWASLLLASWYTHIGRLVEAQHSIAATMQFAVACGLPYETYGQVTSAVSPSVMLPSPSSESDMLDRRNLWCGISMLDSTIPFASGIQTVTTSERVVFNDKFIQNPIYNDDLPLDTLRIRDKTWTALCAVRQFSAEARGQPRSQAFFNRANDLSRMLVAVGSILRPLNSEFGLAPGEVISLANPDFVVAHIHLYSATLVLCNLQREDDPMMNDRAIKAAVAIANVARHLRSCGRLELIHSSLTVMMSVHHACEVLIREMIICSAESPSPGKVERATAAEQHLEGLLDFEVELMIHCTRVQGRRGYNTLRGILAGTETFMSL